MDEHRAAQRHRFKAGSIQFGGSAIRLYSPQSGEQELEVVSQAAIPHCQRRSFASPLMEAAAQAGNEVNKLATLGR
jgi:hypothetical protein